MKTLTPRQQEILELIREHVEATGYPPTRADIAVALGFRSANAAEEHLRALARKGAIELTPGASRGIRLPEQGEGLPVIGRVAAGAPTLAEEHIERRCAVERGLFEPAADYLLRVRGMSMRDAGILEDDLVAVHRTTEVRDGQIVVARLADEVTVKRLERRGARVRLLPENPDYTPIEPDPERDELAIEGRVVGLIRRGEPQ